MTAIPRSVLIARMCRQPRGQFTQALATAIIAEALVVAIIVVIAVQIG